MIKLNEWFPCCRCGREIKRRRWQQRYCSERCRNAAVQERKRRKLSRSGDKNGPLQPAKEATATPIPGSGDKATCKYLKLLVFSGVKKQGYPIDPSGLARCLRRPVAGTSVAAGAGRGNRQNRDGVRGQVQATAEERRMK